MATLSDNEFVELLSRHRDEFYRYVMRNVWNPDTAEDVISGAVLAAYRQLDKFEKGTNFRAWMYRILTNKCFVANRETKRSAIDLDAIDERHFAVEPDAQRKACESPAEFLQQCGDELFTAMRQLSTAERSCLLLLTMERYAYREIAGILEMPVGTVMTHLARGRAKLRRLLGEYAKQQGIVGKAADHDRAAGSRLGRAS
jgi:RNA polymerase sigma-70 factor, ECF subfamily